MKITYNIALFPFEKKAITLLLSSLFLNVFDRYTGRNIALQGKLVIFNVHLLFSLSASQY